MVILTFVRQSSVHTNDIYDAHDILKTVISEVHQFVDTPTAKLILPVYDYDYSVPLGFMHGSEDLLLKTYDR
jgi:hypothetical protein